MDQFWQRLEAPPRLYISEQELTVAPHSDARIEAFVRGSPVPWISIEFSGQTIYDSREQVTCEHPGWLKYSCEWYESGRFVFLIHRVGEEDQGPYKVCVQNRAGVDEHIINLMLAEPPIFTSPLLPYVELLQRWGGKVSCGVSGTPRPKVTWYKDWRRIAPSQRFTLEHGESMCAMAIGNAMERDTGQYTCVAENIAGRAVSHCYIQIKPVTQYLTRCPKSSYELIY